MFNHNIKTKHVDLASTSGYIKTHHFIKTNIQTELIQRSTIHFCKQNYCFTNFILVIKKKIRVEFACFDVALTRTLKLAKVEERKHMLYET